MYVCRAASAGLLGDFHASLTLSKLVSSTGLEEGRREARGHATTDNGQTKVTRLILTGSSGLSLVHAGLADLVVPFMFRFVWGPLPSKHELAGYLGERSAKHGTRSRWTTYIGRWRSSHEARKDLGLIDFCKPYKTIELWFDPGPNDQLQLIWLLDYFASHPETAAKLRLRLIDFDLIEPTAEELGRWHVPTADITEEELRTASMAWQAYRAPTPQACFDLLGTDLSALPHLRVALLDLLEELPSATTGLGATEMRFLELLARGYDHTNSLFHIRRRLQRRVFDEWEKGALLEALALGPTPAVAGLDEALRTLPYENYRGRHEIYLRSTLSLTEFGWDVVAHKADFSRHNPIHRWWGGTEFTSDRLWRWAPALMKP